MPLAERFLLIRTAGFDAVSLWWDAQEEHLPLIQAMPALARDAGLVIESIHVPFRKANNLWSDDASKREPVITEHLAWIDECAAQAIPRLVMHVVSGNGPAEPTAAGMDSLQQFIVKAEARHITLALENTRRPDLLDAIFATFPSPWLGMCYDTSHDRLWPVEAPGLLKRYGDRLVTTHFSDTDGSMDRHFLPGDGVIDWPAVAAAFPKIYTGPLMLEVMSYKTPDLSPEAFLAEAYRRATWLHSILIAQ